MKKRKKSDFQSVKNLLNKYNWNEKKYISREFQDYGYRLAIELDDEKHKALYIKLAKTVDRNILEEARVNVKHANNVRNKGKLFMWKVKELKTQSAKLKTTTKN